MERVFIIGVSGIEFWSIFEKEPELLPHLTQWMVRGIYGRIARIPQASLEEMWAALYTGRSDGSLNAPVWEVVARAGRQAIAVSVPLQPTMPTMPIGNYASSPDLAAKVEEVFGGAEAQGADPTKADGLMPLCEQMDRRLEATTKLLRDVEWDMLVTVLLDPGKMALRLQREKGGQSETVEAEAFIRAYWRHADEGLGRLLALSGTETTVVLIASEESVVVEGHQDSSDQLDWGLVIFADAHIGPAMMLGRVEVVDVAPTILELLGVPIPEEMTGRALEDVIGTGDARSLTEEEALLIQKHLMGLGYLE